MRGGDPLGPETGANLCRGKDATRQQVARRKTDAKDAEWIADLLCHGCCAQLRFPEPHPRTPRALPAQGGGSLGRNRRLKILGSANITSRRGVECLDGLTLRALMKKGRVREMAELATKPTSNTPELKLKSIPKTSPATEIYTWTSSISIIGARRPGSSARLGFAVALEVKAA
jgi:hypothetical protein